VFTRTDWLTLRVLELHLQGQNTRQVGGELGITHQWVSMLLERLGLRPHPRKRREPVCKTCGIPFLETSHKETRCPRHRKTLALDFVGKCGSCGRTFRRYLSTITPRSPGKFCSRWCRDEARRGVPRVGTIPKTCTVCGETYLGVLAAKKSICQGCYSRGRRKRAS
jgi:hypothetical protein